MKILFGKKGACQMPRWVYVFYDESSCISKPLPDQSKAASIFVNVTIVLHYLFSICLVCFCTYLQPESFWLTHVENVSIRLLIFFACMLSVFAARIALCIISSPLLGSKLCAIILFPYGLHWRSILTPFRFSHDREAPASKQKCLLYHALPLLLFTVLPALCMIVFQRFFLLGFLFFMSTPAIPCLATICNVLRAPKGSMILYSGTLVPTEPMKAMHLRVATVRNGYMEIRDYLAQRGRISQIIPDRTNEILEKDTQNTAEKHDLTDIRYLT